MNFEIAKDFYEKLIEHRGFLLELAFDRERKLYYGRIAGDYKNIFSDGSHQRMIKLFRLAVNKKIEDKKND